MAGVFADIHKTLDYGGSKTIPITNTNKYEFTANIGCGCIQAGAEGAVIAAVTGPDNAAGWAGFSVAAGQTIMFANNLTSITLSSGAIVAYEG